LSILTIIFLIWVAKLSFILLGSLYFGPQSVFKINEAESVLTVEYTGILVTAMPVDLELVAPEIKEVAKGADDTIIFRGDGPPNFLLSVFLRSEDSGGEKDHFKIYSVDIYSDGRWEIIQNKGVFYPTPGKYSATAVSYNQKENRRSKISNAISFDVGLTSWEKIVRSVDTVLNYSIIGFIIIGVILAILLA